jgi:transcription elongation factor/antiterminator RfaH
MRCWYVARTKPRREVAAAAILAQRGVDVYLPTVSSRRRASTSSRAGEALFPGYLFAQLDIGTDDWLAARSAPGVAYFLGSGEGAPTPVPNDLIDAIRLRADQQAGKARVIPFRQGESVLIKDGPFAGIQAVFDGCLSGRGRVRVLLEIVQRVVPVDLEVHQLGKVASVGSHLVIAS